LIIKTSWGGKSLHYNFRPPSATDFKSTKAYTEAKASAEKFLLRYEEAVKNFPENKKKYAADLAAYEEKIKVADGKAKKKLRKPRKPRQPKKPKPFNMDDAGVNYRMMNEKVSEVLGNLKKHHPDYNEKAGYEIAGFVWFQGFNDKFNPEYHGNYTENMKLFIQDVRKEYKAPDMPFIIGVLGTSQTEEKVAQNAVSVAQREVAKAPEFKGNVLAVESYTEYALDSLKVYNSGWADHYCQWDTVGSDRPYHYLGSGKFFVRFGDALATAMVELIIKQK
jgi:alpha-galactosidase